MPIRADAHRGMVFQPFNLFPPLFGSPREVRIQAFLKKVR